MHGAQRSRRGRFLKGRESSARKLTPEWFAGNQGSGLISSILAADNHCQKAVYSGPKAFKNTMNEGPRLALQCWVQELPASSGWEGTGSSHTACALGIKDVGINNKYPDSQRWQKLAIILAHLGLWETSVLFNPVYMVHGRLWSSDRISFSCSLGLPEMKRRPNKDSNNVLLAEGLGNPESPSPMFSKKL